MDFKSIYAFLPAWSSSCYCPFWLTITVIVTPVTILLVRVGKIEESVVFVVWLTVNLVPLT